MKTGYACLIIAAICLAAAGPASAISRYQSMSMTCAEAQNKVRQEGAVILRHPSLKVKGMTLYDRYVRDSRQCNINEYADEARVPTADNPKCRVLNCQVRSSFDDTIPWYHQ